MTTETGDGDPTTGDGDPTTTGDGDPTTGDGDGDPTGDGDGDPGGGCGDGILDDGEMCDGDELGGEDCLTQGFDEGTLACNDDCTYDTSACVMYSCGNDMAEARETCDGTDLAGEDCLTQGFDEGTLACNDDCMGYNTDACVTWMCGNDMVEGMEMCDGTDLAAEDCSTQGFDSGTLACAMDCTMFDTAGCGLCGDAMVGGTEECDMDDLAGEDCTTQGFTAGTLACDDMCALDTSGCFDCVEPDPNMDADVAPDNFGYFMIHSTNQNNLCAHQFIDLSMDNMATTTDASGNCGDSSVAMQLPMPFSFYGTDYTDWWVNACGFIATTDDSGGDFTNDCPLPANPSTGNGARMYSWHDDLELKNGGVAYYRHFDSCPRPSDTLGDVACEVFHWSGLTPWNQNMPTWDTNLILYPDTGGIVMAYNDQTPSLASVTIGIQNEAFDDGISVCNEQNQPPFSNDGSTCFYHPSLSCG